MTHKYSIETLFHFNCGECKRWWSIGDFVPEKYKYLACPHCGKISDFEETANDLTKTEI